MHIICSLSALTAKPVLSILYCFPDKLVAKVDALEKNAKVYKGEYPSIVV